MLRWAGLVARLVLGVVWVWAGLLKIGSPEASVSAVRAYQLLPASVAELVGRVLPVFEIVLGACLLVGLLTRLSGLLSALLQLAFVVGIASVWARGIAIDCGCFGGGGYDPHAFEKYPWEIARDSGLMVLALFVTWLRTTSLSLDSLLFPPRSEAVGVEEAA